MKRFVLCLLIVLLFFNAGIVCLASSLPYVGNKTTKVYHMVECTWGHKIRLDNRIYFNSREAAEIQGYRRCQYCGDELVENGNGGESSNNKRPASRSTTVSGTVSKSNTGENTIGTIIGFLVYGGLTVWLICLGISGMADKKKRSHTIQKHKPRNPEDPNKAIRKTSIPQGVTHISLKSSFIASAAYSEPYLYITFTNGRQLTYYQVPQKVFDELTNAKSPGQYFHAKIRNIYPYI